MICTSVMGLMIAFLAGCYYDDVLPDDLKLSNGVPEVVSFANDLLPIFDQSCSFTGCHNTGGHEPDLSPANAYNSLIGGGFINTASPESSELYQWMKGNRDLPMPDTGPNAAYNALVLAWIRQGAKNN